jgi:hypothetical protein
MAEFKGEETTEEEINTHLVHKSNFRSESFPFLSHGNLQRSLNLVHNLCITFLLGLPTSTLSE